jgi:hypothetical protein
MILWASPTDRLSVGIFRSYRHSPGNDYDGGVVTITCGEAHVMNLIVLVIVLLFLFGGGGFYYGGPYIGGGLGTIFVIVLVILLVRG